MSVCMCVCVKHFVSGSEHYSTRYLELSCSTQILKNIKLFVGKPRFLVDIDDMKFDLEMAPEAAPEEVFTTV